MPSSLSLNARLSLGPSPAQFLLYAQEFARLGTVRFVVSSSRTAGDRAGALAWLTPLAIFLAQGQTVFFVWVTFDERKWSILAKRS